MYDVSDPRSALGTATTTPAPMPEAFAPADVGRFDVDPPQEDGSEVRTWLLRGENLVVAYSEARSGAVLARESQLDEYAVLLPEADAGATVIAGGESVSVAGDSLVFVPPGESRIEMTGDGPVVRLFTARSTDLTERCVNVDAYRESRANIPRHEAWPTPADGFRIRPYSLDVAPEPGRFGRIWRCTTIMVNVLEPGVGPRDVTRLSPHHHDDFEQYSLALEGAFTHHLRWPWTPNMLAWRDDEAIEVPAPSVTVIPPPAIHTSRGTDPAINRLVDIFAPPRRDFSEKPGWVLNADDYPMPD